MPYDCDNCGGSFSTGPGLASHTRARKKNGGVCTDSRKDAVPPAGDELECQHCGKICASATGLASHERARVQHGVCKDADAPVQPRQSVRTATAPAGDGAIRTRQPSPPADLSPEEAREYDKWWRNPDGSLKLSQMTGKKMLNPQSRDFVINEAAEYAPEKLTADGRDLR